MPTEPLSGSTPQPGVTSANSQNEASAVHHDTPHSGRGRARVPPAVERHFLREDNRYLFSDRTLAFIDDGTRIRVQTENPEVLRGVVAIAESRGWGALSIRGTESFRQLMWREAALRGIEVHGYAPTEAEIRWMQRVSNRSPPAHDQGSDPTIVHNTTPKERRAPIARRGPDNPGAIHDAAPRPTEMTQATRSARMAFRSTVRGLLVAAAAAPYRFDPAQRMSFYVTVRTETGERTVWGADLERALVESASRPRIGDQVTLTRHGAPPGKVPAAQRNARGEVSGEKWPISPRALWSIETPQSLRAMEEHAMRIRRGDTVSREARRQHPQLEAVAAGLKLAEHYATRVTADQDSRRCLVQLIRERIADALAQGRSIHLPDRGANPDPAAAAIHVHVRQRTIRDRGAPDHERV